MAELSVLALLTLIVLITVVRPLLRQVLAPVPGAPALAGPDEFGDAAAIGAGGTVAMIERDNPTARLMEFAKINGQIQADTVQRVVDMVRASPTETVEVLRTWIQEE